MKFARRNAGLVLVALVILTSTAMINTRLAIVESKLDGILKADQAVNVYAAAMPISALTLPSWGRH